MKKISQFLLLCVLVLISCQTEKKIKTEKIPDEWSFAQRVYPFDQINQSAVKEARQQYQKIYLNNNQKNSNPWETKGPTNIGGRVTDIARHPTNSEIFYAGLSVGGVFKTSDGGQSWTPIFDDIASLSIGNLAVSESNPDVIYVGTGEANGNANSGAFFGTGIYKSEDAGMTWKNVGLENSNHISRIVIDKNDSNIVHVAVAGLLYGRNEERGVYRTLDGGDTWEQILYRGDNQACIDLVVHPTNRNVIYAALWERERFAWVRDYGGPLSAIYKTTDGGVSWRKLDNGLPEDDSERGRIGLAISESDPNTVYASLTTNEITNVFEGLYKTEDGGLSWENADNGLDTNVFSAFGWFFGNIRVNPESADNIFVLGLNAYKSSNAGDGDWVRMNGPHVDWHALEFFKGNPDDIVVGTDGGLYRSFDRGNTFEFLSNIPITQFYKMEVDFQDPSRIFGGTQDNGTVASFSGAEDTYRQILGGDGFTVLVDPNDPDFMYGESQWGRLSRSVDGGFSFQLALDGIDGSDRTNWSTPLALSPVDSRVMYYGSNKLYVSERAENWLAISEDLTNGEHPSGVTSFGTLTTIAPSHQNVGTIYVGSDDGNVWVTRDNGNNWKSINAGLPNRYVTSIAVNPYDEGEAIVTFSGYRQVDYQPHILITKDYGDTWTDISSNLPEVPINDIEYNSEFDDTFYIATDLGVWFTEDEGLNWEILGTELPAVVVSDLKVHWPTKTLYAATFARSIVSIDLEDLSSTEEELRSADFIIFPNPSAAQSELFVQLDSKQVSVLDIHDISGQLVRKIKSPTDKQSIGQLAKGQYVATIKNANSIFSKPFIVQ